MPSGRAKKGLKYTIMMMRRRFDGCLSELTHTHRHHTTAHGK